MIRILVVEDEEAIAQLLRMNLTHAGYACEVAADGLQGADCLQDGHYDLCILDIMLPEIDGYELLSYAKSMEIPVIFLTAKSKTEDLVKGLRLGAEDYITKPFAMLELLARVETVLRRSCKLSQEYDICGLHIDAAARRVTRGGQDVALTCKEFDLLELFAQNPGKALYREMIYEHVWGSPYRGDSRTVDLHVQRLRKKAGLENELQAVYKVGYRLEEKGL